MRSFTWLLAVMMAAQPTGSAAAENVLDEARRQYEAAAYEDALSTLAKADRSSRAQIIEVEQYRALCLIALGRMSEAETAITAIVETDPLYVPTASPKVQAIISDVRRKVLPAVARRLLEDGRTAFTEKDLQAAREHFTLLRRILDDPAMRNKAEITDLRVLADGFSALVSASPTPSTEPATEFARGPVSSAEPTPPNPPVIVPAVAVREVLPPWVPDQVSARTEFAGTLKLKIGADGRVKSATIQKPSHPAYDARLVQAANTWRYQPATRNGQPVESERMIAVRLRPAQ